MPNIINNIYPRTCVYAGWDTLYLRTYSTTWSGFNNAPWSFHDGGLQPQEVHGFTNGGVPVGYWANILDSSLPGGAMNVQLGDVSVAHQNDGSIMPPWHKSVIQGWCVNTNSLVVQPMYTFARGCKLSTNPLIASFNIGNQFNVPSGTGNGAPVPYTGFNTFTPDGGFSASYEIGFGRLVRTVENNVISAIATGNWNLNSTTAGIVNAIPRGNVASVQLICASGKTNLDYMETDWLNYSNQYNITFTNPVAANFDMNTIYQNNGTSMPNSTYAGFWLPQKQSISFEGMTLATGWILAIAPDYRSYRIYKIIPIDVTAQGITNLIGQWAVKIDTQGVAWFKNPNWANILLVSGGSVLKQLPIFPPVPLPASEERDAVPALMRSQ